MLEPRLLLSTAPINDDFDSAIDIASVPFRYNEDTSGATTAPDDPLQSGRGASVWFKITPAQSSGIEVDTFGSNYDTTLAVYTGSRGALDQLIENDDANGTSQSQLQFGMNPGATYYICASSFSGAPGGSLVFNVNPSAAPPPIQFTTLIPDVRVYLDPTTGAGAVTGLAAANRACDLTIRGQMIQDHGNSVAFAFASGFFSIGPDVSKWVASFAPAAWLANGRTLTLFVPGRVHLSLQIAATEPSTGYADQRSFEWDATLSPSPQLTLPTPPAPPPLVLIPPSPSDFPTSVSADSILVDPSYYSAPVLLGSFQSSRNVILVGSGSITQSHGNTTTTASTIFFRAISAGQTSLAEAVNVNPPLANGRSVSLLVPGQAKITLTVLFTDLTTGQTSFAEFDAPIAVRSLSTAASSAVSSAASSPDDATAAFCSGPTITDQLLREEE